MNLLPFENIDFNSPLTESEITDAIKINVAWTTELGLTFTKNSLRDYEGFVDNNTFKIRRILKSGRNSFIPIASGIISKKENGTRIELKLRLHKVVMILAIVFTIFSGSLIITSLLNKPLEKEQFKESLNELLNDEELVREMLSQNIYEDLESINEPKEMSWIGLLLFITPYLMCTIFFNYEARIVKDKLKTLLKI